MRSKWRGEYLATNWSNGAGKTNLNSNSLMRDPPLPSGEVLSFHQVKLNHVTREVTKLTHNTHEERVLANSSPECKSECSLYLLL